MHTAISRPVMLLAGFALLTSHATASSASDLSGPYLGISAIGELSSRVSGPSLTRLGSLGTITNDDSYYGSYPIKESFIPEFQPNFLALGLFGGINFFDGHILFGIEANGQSSLSSYTAKASLIATNPDQYASFTQSGCCMTTPLPTTKVLSNGYMRSLNQRQTYRFKKSESGDLSMRVGYQIGRLLVFGKVGAGEVKFSETLTEDNTASQFCTHADQHTVYSPSGSETPVAYSVQTFISCPGTTNGTRASQTDSKIAPEFLVGFGVEYHMTTHFFLRADAELHHAFAAPLRLEYDNDQAHVPSGISSVKFAMSVGVRL